MASEIPHKQIDFSALGRISFKQMDAETAATVLRWHYDAPYDFYNFPPSGLDREIHTILAPENHFYAVVSAAREVVGYCCFGREAQVPGGEFTEAAVDIGLMLRPDLTGRGLGRPIARLVVAFGSRRWPAEKLRVTIAAFNKRALRVWQALGFVSVAHFAERGSGTPFCILTRNRDGHD